MMNSRLKKRSDRVENWQPPTTVAQWLLFARVPLPCVSQRAPFLLRGSYCTRTGGDQFTTVIENGKSISRYLITSLVYCDLLNGQWANRRYMKFSTIQWQDW